VSELQQRNDANNEAAEITTILFYKDKMNEVFGPLFKCLPPELLTDCEEKHRSDALRQFESKRTFGMEDDDDDVKRRILGVIRRSIWRRG
jgi:hypothetical protein